MTTKTAEQWLRSRAADAPGALLHEMLAALRPRQGATVPDTLADAAMALYTRVGAGCGGREDAMPLLAADALLTHAVEAQAQADRGSIAAAAQRWGAAGALGEIAAAGRLGDSR